MTMQEKNMLIWPGEKNVPFNESQLQKEFELNH